MDHGAHFHNCDFQVHTSRDPKWKGARPATDATRRTFAADLVAACRSKSLDAIAVTDHHDFALYPYVREAAANETDESGEPLPPDRHITVFPGLELTLAVPCQALLILDADFPVDRLDGVLERLGIEISDPAEACHDEPQPVAHVQSLKFLYEELDKASWLRGHYIVLPNVTDSGHKSLMRAGMQQKYREMPCVGGYVDGGVGKIGEGNTRIFSGGDKKWGNKSLAIIQTSDARTATFDTLGKHPTWVKWAEPTAEAIRQACLASRSRIAHTRPSLPSTQITRLSVSNSRHLGPLDLELNPQYNAIIGGRGTGKSTCLEYLRWALCDQPPAAGDVDDLADHAGRRKRLIDQTLAQYNATVDVHFSLNGVPHIVRRSADTGEVTLSVGGGDFTSTTPANIRALLPINAYSQKQLSSVSVRIEELIRFITAPILGPLGDLDTRISRVDAEIRENFAGLQRFRGLSKSVERDLLSTKSLEEQAAGLRADLKDLDPKDQELLDKKPEYDRADELIRSYAALVDESSTKIDGVVSALELLRSEPVIDDPAGLAPDLASQVERVADTAERLVSQVLDSLSEAHATLETERAVAGGLDEVLGAWESSQAAFEARYAAAKERSSSHQTKLDQLAQIEGRRKQLSANLRDQRSELQRLGDPGKRHEALLRQWITLQRERGDLLEKQCEELTKLSDAQIRATVKRSTGSSVVLDKFRSTVSGSGVRTNKIEGFIARIAEAADPLDAWQSAMTELESIVIASDDTAARQWTPTTVLSTFATADIERLRSRLTPEAVLDLALTPFADTPEFEYRVKRGEYIGFDLASAGQQATALLRVLLSQPGPPLIIDQPEDDLDTQEMTAIVELIWAAKERRQLVFASHNANLVVNGDAELVACCDYRTANDQSGGRIKLQGAIDMPAVRDEITKVMEGGEKAFRLRKEKYGF